MAKEMKKRDLMNIIVFTVVQEWLRCAECGEYGGTGEKKQVRVPLFYTPTTILIKAEDMPGKPLIGWSHSTESLLRSVSLNPRLGYIKFYLPIEG